jgi:hypothetical protein
MKTRPRLAVVPVIAGSNTSNVIHISGIRSHGPALDGAPIRLWPRRHEWRNLMRRIMKSHGKSGPGEDGGR